MVTRQEPRRALAGTKTPKKNGQNQAQVKDTLVILDHVTVGELQALGMDVHVDHAVSE